MSHSTLRTLWIGLNVCTETAQKAQADGGDAKAG